jgi:hypothetical protein
MLGTILSGVVLLFLFGMMIAGMATMAENAFGDVNQKVHVANNSVLRVSFNTPIKERGNPNDVKFNFSFFSSTVVIGLDEILASF